MKPMLSKTLHAAVGAAALMATPLSVLDALAAAPPERSRAAQPATELQFETAAGKTIKVFKKGDDWTMTDQELYLKSGEGTVELKNGARLKFSKGLVIGTEGTLVANNDAGFKLGPSPDRAKAAATP